MKPLGAGGTADGAAAETARGAAVEAVVFDGDTRAALAVVRSLGRRGVRITVAAARIRSLAGTSRYAGRRVLMPDPVREPGAFAAALKVLAAERPGTLWVPVTDATLAAVDRVRADLHAVRILLPEAAALAIAWDKGRLLAAAAAAGFAVPRTWTPQSAAEIAALAPSLDYPAVLKPRWSRLVVGERTEEGTVLYVRTPAELVAAWQAVHARIPFPLVQERIPGYGMGLFLLADRGRIVASFAHCRRREKPPTGGVSVLSESVAIPPALMAPAERLLAELAWSGVCMLELKVDARDGTPRIMEMNPRFWGSLALAVASGVDFPWLLYQAALGVHPLSPPAYQLGVRSRWELGDLDHLVIRLGGRGEADLPPGSPTRLGAVIRFLNPFAGRPEVFALGDPEPFAQEIADYLGRRAPGPARRTGPRHVLQLIETGGPGGAERVLVSLAAALQDAPGYRSSAALLEEGWAAAELRARGLPYRCFRLKRALDPGLVLALAAHLRRNQVDLVHAHEFTMNVYGTMAARLAGVPAIATIHGRGYYAEAARRMAALRLAARAGAMFVAVSSDIQRFLTAEVGLGAVRLVPNGIDVERPAAGDRARGRLAIGVGPGEPLIGTIGNLYPVKGHRVLLEAAARLSPAVHVAIAGRGEEEAELRRRALELGIGDRLHLLGYRTDTADLLAAFDIYALPSFSEGQSLALMEAMAAGLPIAATRVGGNPEVLGRDGESGIYVPPGDPVALAAALARLLGEPETARRLGAAAQARARSELSLAVMVGRYRALYDELLARGSQPRAGAADPRGIGA
jgi:glycosyltransferase involved in cell wall biosynthesis/predicted ATP-grasp superfamily ATP-dependent carboligase